MLQKIKENLHHIIYLLLIVMLAYFTQSYYKKYELFEQEKKIEIQKIESEKLELKNKIITLEKESLKIKNELSKKNRSTKITIKQNADGSFLKEISKIEINEIEKSDIDKNKESSKNEDLSINQDINKKELTTVQENVKIEKEEVKKSNGIWMFIGGVAVCVVSGMCHL